MKETVTITKIFRGKQDTKWGEKDKVGIKTNKHGEKWLTTFKTKGTEKWAENDTVDIYIEEKNGFLNFTLEPKLGANPELEARVKRLEDSVFGARSEKDEEIRNPEHDDF